MLARFEGLPRVSTFTGRLDAMPAVDALVTAGNAYGVMTAGIDAAVVARFGRGVMATVQRHIVGAFLGEQPVGTAFVLETGDPKCPWLVHAPTMRVPGSIVGTDAVYRATWGALVAIHQHEAMGKGRIARVCLPAMGCGFGGMSFDESGRQMAAAWRHALSPPTSIGADFDLAVERERRIAGRG